MKKILNLLSVFGLIIAQFLLLSITSPVTAQVVPTIDGFDNAAVTPVSSPALQCGSVVTNNEVDLYWNGQANTGFIVYVINNGQVSFFGDNVDTAWNVSEASLTGGAATLASLQQYINDIRGSSSYEPQSLNIDGSGQPIDLGSTGSARVGIIAFDDAGNDGVFNDADAFNITDPAASCSITYRTDISKATIEGFNTRLNGAANATPAEYSCGEEVIGQALAPVWSEDQAANRYSVIYATDTTDYTAAIFKSLGFFVTRSSFSSAEDIINEVYSRDDLAQKFPPSFSSPSETRFIPGTALPAWGADVNDVHIFSYYDQNGDGLYQSTEVSVLSDACQSDTVSRNEIIDEIAGPNDTALSWATSSGDVLSCGGETSVGETRLNWSDYTELNTQYYIELTIGDESFLITPSGTYSLGTNIPNYASVAYIQLNLRGQGGFDTAAAMDNITQTLEVGTFEARLIVLLDVNNNGIYDEFSFDGDVDVLFRDDNSCTLTTVPAPVVETPTSSSSSSSSSSSGSSGSGSTSPAQPTACAAATPTTVSNLRVAQQTTNSVTLAWDRAAGATHYAIEFFDANGTRYGAANIGDTNQYTINNLSGGQTYTFEVFAVNECKPGERSNQVTVTVTGAVVEGRPVGQDNQVLGATDEPAEEATQSAQTTDEAVTTTDDGQVLGADECSNQINWILVAILVVAQLGLLIAIWSYSKQLPLPAWVLVGLVTVLAVVIGQILTNCQCQPSGWLASLICSRYWLVALVISLITSGAALVFQSEDK